ncbi:acyl-CoA carboxylase subunit epsilon [Cryobacterium sp. Sr8]|uniref:Acyl-CoA carboxylase epsilon subunit n=1 Tax=Cryobacterium psychrotolerans TaxID=386301 RepID=A0A1G9CMZ5_9MICO|nr:MULTISPECIES: acyl-CoA carboxylase epsilon subunit [Cryobacterium]TFD45058.1 acyl-CoA carboxylase subunit epsilon [Cryobacterium sp. TMT1-2-1]TFD74047.1 acyl-CoA carboxylase subunit epsilon [Cryobacterium sp. Sr8]TFD84236.1 acyl-CoA carboxylase subunit epsilon [Cryobacterium psychrotolerans]SDK52959.1 Acyl-CoA carboxylase epsilon subunit [Cryobacterium psychrotolerans]
MTASTNSADFDPSELAFVTRRVTDAEASAVTAVLRGVLQEESDGIRAAPERGQSAWQVSQRGIRGPMTPGHGRWRGFSA